MEPILYSFGKKSGRFLRSTFGAPVLFFFSQWLCSWCSSCIILYHFSFTSVHPSFFLDSTENNIVCLMLFLNIEHNIFFTFLCLSFIPPGLLLRLPLLLLIFSFFSDGSFASFSSYLPRIVSQNLFLLFPMMMLMMISYLNELYSNGNVVFDDQRILV